MKRYIKILLFLSMASFSCTKEKELEPRSVGEIYFSLDNVDLVFNDIIITDVSLDNNQGLGKVAYGRQIIGEKTYTVMIDFKLVNETYHPHKFQINVKRKIAQGSSYIELHYANLSPELNTTNFLFSSKSSENILEGAFSGELVSADGISPIVRIGQGKFRLLSP